MYNNIGTLKDVYDCVYFLIRTDFFPTFSYIMPLSISWLPLGTYAPLRVVRESEIITISATCQSDYRHASLRRHV